MMVLINSCMITHYIVEENIFAVTVYKILEEQKHWNEILKITLILMVSKWLRCLRKVNTLDLKIMKNITIYDLQKFWGNYISTRRSWKAKSNKCQKYIACSYGY